MNKNIKIALLSVFIGCTIFVFLPTTVYTWIVSLEYYKLSYFFGVLIGLIGFVFVSYAYIKKKEEAQVKLIKIFLPLFILLIIIGVIIQIFS
jgi:H+/Cl- antiporter ClcA